MPRRGRAHVHDGPEPSSRREMPRRGRASGGGTGPEAPGRPWEARVRAAGPARCARRAWPRRSAVVHVAWVLGLGLAPVLLSAQDAEQKPSPYDFAQVALRADCDPAVRAPGARSSYSAVTAADEAQHGQGAGEPVQRQRRQPVYHPAPG